MRECTPTVFTTRNFDADSTGVVTNEHDISKVPRARDGQGIRLGIGSDLDVIVVSGRTFATFNEVVKVTVTIANSFRPAVDDDLWCINACASECACVLPLSSVKMGITKRIFPAEVILS